MDRKQRKDDIQVTCQICGEQIIPPGEEEMFLHMVLNHPLDLITHKRVVGFIGEFFNRLGGSAAEHMKKGIKR
jgi:hypothetical protein